MSHPANARLDQWIAKADAEDVLEPDLPIIDPHHHLWDLRPFQIEPFSQFQAKVYLCEDMMQEIAASGHNIRKTVFAECLAFYRASGPEALRPVGETEFAHGMGAMSRSGIYGETELCAGIFSAADLRLGKQVEPVLKAHINASANFRGIRSIFPSNLNDDFMAGYKLLAKYNLSFDHYTYDSDRLPLLAKLAAAVPDVTIIVNHLGGKVDAEQSKAEADRWRANIDAIAKYQNVVMKVGGAQQRVGEFKPSFHIDHAAQPIHSEALCAQLFDYYAHAINAFGPERAMFESNFPVDKEGISYRSVWNAFKLIAAKLGMSEADKAMVFHDTAARVYRLT